jgi:hypothetical protein
MGDSILKNNPYVKYGYAVDDILRLKTDKHLYNFARENAKISDIYEQLKELEYIDIKVYNNFFDIDNDPSTLLFLSVGGNDILEKYRLNGDITNDDIIQLFDKYKILIKTIKEKLPCVKLIVMNLYHIIDKDINKIIDTWNSLLNESYSDILDLSNLLTEPGDLRQIIEPSEVGGKKIADKIMEFI